MANIKIIVERLGSGSTEPTGGKQSPRGIIARQLGDEAPGRRRRKAEGFINFYDTGQIKIEGVWTDLEFNRDNGYTIETVLDSGYSEHYTIPPFALADWNYLISQLKEVPLEQWKDTYRKIEFADAENYGLVDYRPSSDDSYNPLTTRYPNWTMQGLKPNTSERTQIVSFGLSLSAGFGDAYKITSGDTFGAAEVSFDEKRGCDVFLIPHVGNARGFTRPDPYLEYLHTQYAIASREVFAGNYLKYNYTNPHPDLTLLNSIIDFFKSRPEAFRYLINVTDGTSSTGSTGAFPLTYDEIFLSMQSVYGAADGFETEPGTLHAVIFQGDNFFYMWKKTLGLITDLMLLLDIHYS